MEYTEEDPMRVVELFAGIGAQAQALEQLGIPFESTVCEIDGKAYASYCAIHGDTPNLGDITKVRRLPADVDLLTWSFPCQDLSIAGDHKGMEEGSGTRSSLAWEVIRLLRTAKAEGTLPEHLLMENVPAILFKKNLPEFDRILDALTELGYTNSYAILNAKDYGTPQSRRRCFMVSSLDGRRFAFPDPCPDGRVLKDVLEDEVDESLYFSAEKIARYEEHRIRHKEAGHGFGWEPTHGEGIGKSVTCNPDRHSSNIIIVSGDLHIPGRHESANRVYGKEGLAPTIPTGAGGGHMPKIDDTEEELRIRYLSPRECWRLMGFTDEAFDRAKAIGTCKTQLYKQAGNSIAVPCLTAIFKGMYLEDSWEQERKERTTLDDYME